MAKIGRPISENPRGKQLSVRFTEDEYEKIKDLSSVCGMNTTDTIRFALEELYKEHLEV